MLVSNHQTEDPHQLQIANLPIDSVKRIRISDRFRDFDKGIYFFVIWRRMRIFESADHEIEPIQYNQRNSFP